MTQTVPATRIRIGNDAPIDPSGSFVLYWMITSRRTRFNFALERAVEHASSLKKPLVILEALRVGYPYASDRLHRFVLDGMADNAERLSRRRVLYYPYVEPRSGAGRGLLGALAGKSCVVVTDWYPAFVVPQMVAAATRQVNVRMEEVDSNSLLPLVAADRYYSRAVDFRRHVQRVALGGLPGFPKADPLARKRLPVRRALPRSISQRWPAASSRLLGGRPSWLAKLPIDHSVLPTGLEGGTTAAEKALDVFLERRIHLYDQRNQPQAEVTSGLSAYLHFGHISAQEAFLRVTSREGWSPERLGSRATGARSGFWGLSASAEAWLDQLVTWRELGFNACHIRDDVDRYDSLPEWALTTLALHARDPRPVRYDRDQLAGAETHDLLWNAAQRQLLGEGVIHNYLRMLWGKKILQWSKDPQTALAVMLELNDRYALDGRDPNSQSGIFWTLGRYDRPWGPERPIFGKVRYMSSKNTARKVRVQSYLQRYEAVEIGSQ